MDVIVREQARRERSVDAGTTGGHSIAMAWSPAMAKSPRNESNTERPRTGRARAAGELVADISGVAFKRFGFVQGAIVSRWPEIVGERYARVSTPESIRFPAGRKAGGTLTLSVEGAHAPLMQHLTPMIVDRVNRFFGHAAIDKIVFRQGRAPNAPKPILRPGSAPVPHDIGENLRTIADPGLRACLESLAEQIAASTGPPAVALPDPIPVALRSLKLS